MRRLKHIFRWVVCLVLGIYLGAVLLLSLPFVQSWIGGRIADVLSEQLGGTKVSVGRVQMGMSGRLIIDDICLWDKQGKEMLTVARTGAKLSILPLLNNQDIQINNAILFSAHAHLYQEAPEKEPNFQFLVDAFKTDNEKKPLPDISIGSILVRHTSVCYDKLWLNETPGLFNPSHIKVKELSLSAKLEHLDDDSLSVNVRKFGFTEKSGFQLKNLSCEIDRVKDELCISNLLCNTPNSIFSIPRLDANISELKAKGEMDFDVTPSDFQAFYGKLSELPATLHADFAFTVDSLSAQVTDMMLNTSDEAVLADIAELNVANFRKPVPDISAHINKFSVKPAILESIKPFVPDIPQQAIAVLNTFGESTLSGDLSYMDESGTLSTEILTGKGNIDLEGKGDRHHVKCKVSTDGFDAGSLIASIQAAEGNMSDSTSVVGNIAFTADADINLPQSFQFVKSTPLQCMPSGKIRLTIQEAEVKNYTYHNIYVDVERNGDNCGINLQANDPAVTASLQANAVLAQEDYSILGLLDIQHFRPQDLHLTKKGFEDLRTKVGIDLAGQQIDNLSGDISVPHIMITDKNGSYTLSSLQITNNAFGNQRDITFKSPYLKANAKGEFDFEDLAHYMQNTVHYWIPGIVNAAAQNHKPCKADFNLTITDPSPLTRLAGIPIHLDKGPLKLKSNINSESGIVNVKADAPSIKYDDQEIINFNFVSESEHQEMTTRMSIAKVIKDNPVDFNFQVDAHDQRLTMQFNWDDHLEHVTKGSIAAQALFHRQGNKVDIDGEVLPTRFQVSDTIWNIQPAQFTFRDDILRVKNFRVKMEDDNRWLAISGKASKSAKDTLFVSVRGIELGYIFEFMHVKPIHMGGQVTGELYGIHLFDEAEAHGEIYVPHLSLNQGDLGHCNATLHWGVTPGNLDLEVHVKDEANNSWIEANGWLHLIKDPDQSLDLKFDIHRGNMYLINRYTVGIMEDMQGRATGQLRVFGTFKDTSLEGQAIINEAALTIPSIGVRYHAIDQPIVVKPDGVELNNIVAYDPMGGPGIKGHKGVVDGRISYEYFRDMTFKFHITGDDILVYNLPDFGDQPFCGVVTGSGNVEVTGRPGLTNIDIVARPTQGAWITYKVSTPTTLTKSKFLTFVDRDNSNATDEESKHNIETEEKQPEGDMYLNFELDITPDAELKLLMDAATGDYITLYGNSRLRATYYNKGNFRMYGNYRVDHGIYRMSIQNAIHKDFQFSKDGTLVFGGDPFEADLGLQAVYTVPSVSLNDLSSRGTFSNNNVRVNCLMNLGGKAKAPRITFDFDIPNVNEDERRMVRSLISTEEERNLQVIYLLGIGRFYTYDYTGEQNQTSTAMNSLLSSTLSGQLNQMFTTLMGGNQNWNIGANLSTGEVGWNDMDVEGMLSGRLLNNRLLINGNFGYRDTPVAASNFIGDFDLQWILNKRGNFILKAYSETNDRYFTKSALTTQGIGILLKKDFIRWTDLFRIKKKRLVIEDTQPTDSLSPLPNK